MLLNLFDDTRPTRNFAEGALLLGGFALPHAAQLLHDIAAVASTHPFRQMSTPGGRKMSVTTTSCGPLGWVSDAKGYRYSPHDPTTHQPWPALPASFLLVAQSAAAAAGYANFQPDSCLINRYEVGAKMGLHQDRDEADLNAPIVSVSLGLPARFLFGGLTRTAPTQRLLLQHGDVVVWGGSNRLAFHAIMPLQAGQHESTGACRFNLTFRKAR